MLRHTPSTRFFDFFSFGFAACLIRRPRHKVFVITTICKNQAGTFFFHMNLSCRRFQKLLIAMKAKIVLDYRIVSARHCPGERRIRDNNDYSFKDMPINLDY